ncbi:phospholipid-transporting ATPase ID [Dendroctonus ponderosae]|uniref:phospholipid-transporting ATPase ID n=1 Tax=Dendroctonus ponderosae TaxID=77166 RepID=UPI0020357F19|nr:phospholipid-transporting ATPase ID [Dendroctonus ponderosae]
MDFELEVFEVYDENEPHTSKKHTKHTRKKCKQKGKCPKGLTNLECSENDISRSKTSVLSGDRRHLSLRESILNVFSKLVVWRGKSAKYRTSKPEKLDSPHTSRDSHKGYIPCDNQRRIHANDRLFNSQFKYASNFIKTSKYSILTFLPLNLFEQFQRLANFYFLCLLVLQLIPAISSLTPVTTALPLIGVLGLTAIKDAYDDIQRHVSDSHVNNRKSRVVRDGKLVQEKWSAVQVGDIIRMDNNTFVAADLLLLTSSEPNGLCYIETSELDGETNLKCRQCLVETAEMGQDDGLISEFDGEIVCEQPNNLLNKFEGILVWKGRTYSLDNDKIILRGCVLRNTAWCYGVVIFAGKDTKLMQNSGKSKFKRTSIDRLLNFLIIGIVFFLLSMCLFCMVACGIWETLVGRYFQTFLPWDTLVPSEPLGGATIIALLVFFSYAIVLNTVVPISLYVSVEVIRFVQSFLINWDEQMYYGKFNTFAKARTTTLNEELGQIEYIFSDKTGTLTQNIMTFNKCSIGGVSYGDVIDPRSGDVIEITDDTEPLDFSFNSNYEPEFRFYDKNLLDSVRRREKDTFLLFRLLALCHTVMSENRDGKLEYQAQSPDEAALVSAARNFGFVFKERTPNSITIEVMGTKEVYELLCILDFNNIRKRMSVILRKDGKLTLYCKGADNVIYERLKLGQDEVKAKTQDHLNKFAGEGLRTLCLAYCDLEENFFNDWKSASATTRSFSSLEILNLNQISTYLNCTDNLPVYGALLTNQTKKIAMDTQYWTVFNHIMIWGSLAFYFVADNFYNYVFNGPYVGSLTKAMGSANFWFATVLIVIMCVLPVLAYRFYFVDVFPTLSDRVRLKQRLAQVRSRQSQDVLRTPSARRARRSIRSGYAFAHQEGFGRLITSGKIMRKLPNAEFTIPNIMNKLNMSNSTKESNRNPPNTAATQEGSSGSSGGRAPIQDLDTINL